MKKVLFVATVVKTHINVFHLPYIKMFKDKGYRVDVAAKNDYEKLEECVIPGADYFHNIPFTRFPLSFKNILAYSKLRKLIRTEEYDIVHAHTPVGGALARLAVWKPFSKKRSKMIYTAHGFHFYRGSSLISWLIYFPIEYLLSFITDELVTINTEDYEFSKKTLHAKKVHYVNGVGVVNSKVNKTSINKDIHLNKNDFVMISVGELNSNKNHQLVLTAMSNLKIDDLKYLICGEGPLKNELIAETLKLGLENNVHFLGYRSDVTNILLQANIFVFPSFREGLSLSVMEAMNSGLPLLCSDIRGNRDLVTEGLGGYLFNPFSVLDLQEKLLLMINNPTILNTMSCYNVEKSSRYSIDNVLEDFEEIYF